MTKGCLVFCFVLQPSRYKEKLLIMFQCYIGTLLNALYVVG